MTTRLLIEHGSVLTMNDADDLIEDGAVLIEDDRIVDVGTTEEVRSRHDLEGVRTIDATDKAVLPGLVDLHFHTAIGKGWSDHLPLWESLFEFWYPMIRALDDDAAYWAALASYLESIKCGVTTVNDMYRKLGVLRRAAEEIGIRAVLSNDIADDEHELDTLDDARTAHREHHGAGNGRIEVYVGIEWLPLASEELLRGARALANELGTGIHIHLNESQTEVDNSMERFGRRPTEVAFDCGILGPDCVAAHCVWLSDHEIDLMKETGTQISHNPSSNAKLGNGIARLPEMLAADINVGLGHDAAESNNGNDMFGVMKFASLVHRALRVDASLQQAPDVLRMATRNGSKALRHETGELTVGKKADVILVELKSATFTPLVKGNRDHLTSHLVFAANGSCVDTTIIDGEVVMEGRNVLTVDEATVLREADAAFSRMLGVANIAVGQ
jgi:5-methylthioadenosine/S-adenosylhomocysteine deaminase